MNAVNSGVSVISGDKTERGELMQSYLYKKTQSLIKSMGRLRKCLIDNPFLEDGSFNLNKL